MSYTAQDIINAALILLEDQEQGRYTNAMLLSFINEAMTDIVKLKPTANVVYSTYHMTAGVYQPLADKQLYLLDVVYNTNDAGTSQGSSPLRINKATLDFSNTDWTSSTRRDEVMYYTYDMDGTRVFFVYPPNTGAGHAYIKTTDIPAALTVVANTVPLREEYRLSIVYYICAKGYMVDTDTSNLDKVSMYKSMYLESINMVSQSDAKQDTKNAS